MPQLNYSMGITAENVAARWNITREQQDCFSFESQRRAAAAKDRGRLRRGADSGERAWSKGSHCVLCRMSMHGQTLPWKGSPNSGPHSSRMAEP